VEKIPVWRSIGRAYGFAFGNLATIIGLIWLPTLILLAGGYFTIAHYFAGVLTAIADGNRYAAYAGAGYFYLYQIAALLFQAIIIVPVMRQALGLCGDGRYDQRVADDDAVHRTLAIGRGAHAFYSRLASLSLRYMVSRTPPVSRALVRRGRGGVSRPCARSSGSVHSAGGSARSGRDRLGFRTQ